MGGPALLRIPQGLSASCEGRWRHWHLAHGGAPRRHGWTQLGQLVRFDPGRRPGTDSKPPMSHTALLRFHGGLLLASAVRPSAFWLVVRLLARPPGLAPQLAPCPLPRRRPRPGRRRPAPEPAPCPPRRRRLQQRRWRRRMPARKFTRRSLARDCGILAATPAVAEHACEVLAGVAGGLRATTQAVLRRGQQGVRCGGSLQGAAEAHEAAAGECWRPPEEVGPATVANRATSQDVRDVD